VQLPKIIVQLLHQVLLDFQDLKARQAIKVIKEKRGTKE
jgi:hypothetical protein